MRFCEKFLSRKYNSRTVIIKRISLERATWPEFATILIYLLLSGRKTRKYLANNVIRSNCNAYDEKVGKQEQRRQAEIKFYHQELFTSNVQVLLSNLISNFKKVRGMLRRVSFETFE